MHMISSKYFALLLVNLLGVLSFLKGVRLGNAVLVLGECKSFIFCELLLQEEKRYSTMGFVFIYFQLDEKEN